jgi:Cu(I)/Ag(I) efflux system membrane fusion protein
MTIHIQKIFLFSLVLAMGFVAGTLIEKSSSDVSMDGKSDQAVPLYWVAPMDANFQRDKPGLSPMGMDLVPVYETNTGDSGAGTVTISPNVIHNLGVRTAAAKILAMDSKIKTVGIVQFDQDKLIHIHPRVEGWVENLYVKTTGAPVKKGQALYALYSPELVNVQQEYIAELNNKNASLIAAAEHRLKSLNISQKVIRQLKRSKKVSQTITFYAPQTGVISNLNIREGFFVKPGTTMMSIGALDQVWVEAEIFERQASFVKIGQQVSMTLNSFPGKEWQGDVDYIYPSLNAKNRTLRARLKFNNKDFLLKPNMLAKVNIHSKTQDVSLVVEKDAVIRSADFDRVVLALGNGQFKSINVMLGKIGDDYIEILKGLSEGEKVVINAQFLLDSESSKQSDFQRMSHPLTLPNATVNGVINNINKDDKSLNISRGPIEKWNRDAATLDFKLSENININSVSAGQKLTFTFEIDAGEFIITEIRPYQSNSNSNSSSNMKGM